MLTVDTSLDGAALLAERIREIVASYRCSYNRLYITATVSVGIGIFKPGDKEHALLEKADRALYKAKSGGRDQVQNL